MSLLVAISLAFATLPLLLQWRDRRFRTRAVRLLGAQARRIAATPIDQLPEGALARAIGTVRPSGPWLVAPFSKTPCAYWRFTVSALEYSAPQRRSRWHQVFDDSQTRRFVLKDGSGTCVVDPESATVDVAVGRRFYYRCGQVPAAVTDVFDRYGIELPHASLLIEEASLAVDASVGVTGIVRRIERPEVVEAGYRSGRPMIAAFDATLGDLLISTERRLRAPQATRRGSDARTARTGGASATLAWGTPGVDEHGRPMTTLDEFEADLRRQSRRHVFVGGLVLAAATLFSGVLVFAGLHQPPAPMLTDEHRAEIVEALARSQIVVSDADDLWRAAIARRDQVQPGDAPCAYERWLADRVEIGPAAWPVRGTSSLRVPVAFRAVHPRDFPSQSPRTEDTLLTLDRVSHELKIGALDARAGELLDEARMLTVDKVDLVIETDHQNHRIRSWLYDHGLDKIACAGTSELTAGIDAMLRGAIASLRAVAEPPTVGVDNPPGTPIEDRLELELEPR